MPAKIKRRTINLLEPIGVPADTWTAIYAWVFNVGRYLMLAIEIIVLVVFFSRFVLDKQNHDLTEEINDKAFLLSNQNFRLEEVRYKNTHLVLNDIYRLSNGQPLNSEDIALLLSSVPSGLTLDKFSYNNGRVSLTVIGSNIATIRDYEFSLRQNTNYENVTFTVSKAGSNKVDYDVVISLSIKLQEDK